jgi:2-polyprenyl-3-methyl-5-hydroxy-6-metoxy-1,4-benzoquinol methylase
MQYTQAYENSLHFSPRFQKFAESLAQELINRHALHGKDMIDIGCGKGDFLKLMCNLGNNRGVGFDSSFVPDLVAKEQAERFTVVQDLYSEKYAHYKADFISCRQVLEHIEYPREFVATVRRSVGDRSNTVVFFEVPNVMYTLRDMGIWDLIYEHCSYFTSVSFAKVFTENGFRVMSQTDLYESQFLGIELLTSATPASAESTHQVKMIRLLVKAFANSYQKKTEEWRTRFAHIALSGKKVVAWGGGSKGTTFLNVLRDYSRIDYMVDINPRKHGMFVAGGGQQVVSPDFLGQYRPDVVIVMNAIYKEEIRRMTTEMGLSPDFLFA